MLPAATQPVRTLPAKVMTSSGPATLDPQIVVRNVTVLRGKASVEVHIDASGPVTPVARVLSDPDRLVIDFPDVGYTSSRRLPVDVGDVQSVRVALFHVDPPVARVVVDLAHPHQYRLLTARSTVILSIDTSEAPAAVASAAAAAVPDTTPPTAAPVGEAAVSTPASETKPSPPGGTASEAPSQSSEATPAPGPAVEDSKLPSEAKLEPPPVATPQPSAAAPTLAAPPLEPRASVEQPDVAVIGIPTGGVQPTPTDDQETTPHQAAKGKKPGLVRNVTVSILKDAVEVRIEANKPMRASAAALSNPERIIIDLADMRWMHPRHIPVKLSEVQAVDVSLYLVNPLVTRVVVNLAHAHPYHLREDGNALIVKIETEEINAAGSQPGR